MLKLRAVGLILCLTTICLGLTLTPPSTNVAVAIEIADLEDQLEKGLRVTTPEQKQFIDRIVKLVRTNGLPVRIVNASFAWSRKRRPDYPFPYFERAVRILAAREGIKI